MNTPAKYFAALVFWLLPIVHAWNENKAISKAFEEKNWDDFSKTKLKTMNSNNKIDFEKIADDVYNFELQRKDMIESKAAALFDASGFVISIISISGIVIANYTVTELLILMLPILYLILSAISSLLALKIGSLTTIWIDSTVQNISKRNPTDKAESKKFYALEKIVIAETNLSTLNKKSNWTYAGQKQFLFGLILTALFIILVYFL